MIRIVQQKHTVYALILALALSGCDTDGPAPVSSAYAQPLSGTMVWAEPGPGAVADGNVEMYY